MTYKLNQQFALTGNDYRFLKDIQSRTSRLTFFVVKNK